MKNDYLMYKIVNDFFTKTNKRNYSRMSAQSIDISEYLNLNEILKLRGYNSTLFSNFKDFYSYLFNKYYKNFKYEYDNLEQAIFFGSRNSIIKDLLK